MKIRVHLLGKPGGHPESSSSVPKEPVPEQGCPHLRILASAPHSEPILSGLSLGGDPKSEQALLCRELSFGPTPEGCPRMGSGQVWHCPRSPVPWQGGLAAEHPLSCGSLCPDCGHRGALRCCWAHLAFLPAIQRLWEEPARYLTVTDTAGHRLPA